jgi:hypothetical protein
MGLSQHRLRGVGSEDLAPERMKQDQVVSRATGTVQHAANLVFGKERAEKFDGCGIVFTESIEEQIVAIGEIFVQVVSHVLCFNYLQINDATSSTM